MRALLSALLMVLPTVAWADYKFLPATDKGAPTFALWGTISVADSEAFARDLIALQSKDDAYVSLASNGGAALAGLEIADLVRRSGLKTWVPDNKTCMSACALIWIAGTADRIAGKNAHIGFHGAYTANTGQQIPIAMAITGALLGYLGLNYDAVIWLTSAELLNMHWLTPEIANKYGIFLSYDKSAPPSPPPSLYAYVPPPGSTAQTSSVKYRVIMNFKLRTGPGLEYPNALSSWTPEDYIPAGEIFEWSNTRTCQNDVYSRSWCQITVRHHHTETAGWVSDRYLERVQ